MNKQPDFTKEIYLSKRRSFLNHNFRRQNSGFTLIEIMIAVAIIGLLVAVAVPSFIKARLNTQKNLCLQNLVKIDGAKHQWAIENGKLSEDTPSVADISPYLKFFPECPARGTYTINSVAELATCSIDRHNPEDGG